MNTTATRRTILLGAGASFPAGIPTATGMVENLCDQIKVHDPRGWALFGRVIDTVIGGLKLHRASALRDPFSPIDVEELYAMLCALRDRNALPITPFVGSWIPGVTASPMDSIRTLVEDVSTGLKSDVRDTLARVDSVQRIAGRASDVRVDLGEFATALRALIGTVTGHDIHIFERAASAVIRALVYLCTIHDITRAAYLQPLLRSGHSRQLWIGTLNYDRSVELAAAAEGVDCDLGIRAGGTVVEFSSNAPVCLAKLHGSVDWSMDADWSLHVGPQISGSEALIFGAGNKLRVEGPYLDLLISFREQLGRTDKIEVCGYSFRDAHVNHMLLRWIQQDGLRRIHVFDPALTVAGIETNVDRALDRGRRLRNGWLGEHLIVEDLGVEEWAARSWTTS